MLDAVCVCLLWGWNTATCLTSKSALVHQYKAVCCVCKAEQWFAACLLSFCSFKYRNPNMCVYVLEFMEESILVAAPDLLTELHCILRSSLREQWQKKGAQEQAGCCECDSLGEEIHPHDLQPKLHECIITRLCVLCATQSSGLQLACSPLCHLNIETQMCVCVCESVWRRAAQLQLLICSLSYICILRSSLR